MGQHYLITDKNWDIIYNYMICVGNIFLQCYNKLDVSFSRQRSHPCMNHHGFVCNPNITIVYGTLWFTLQTAGDPGIIDLIKLFDMRCDRYNIYMTITLQDMRAHM